MITDSLQVFLGCFGIDIFSIALLSYVLYYRRHRDREMALAISSINITLFSLTGALSEVTLPLGVGFALFSVVSIIRLRSDTAGWIEMAYLLTGLAVGLITGLLGVNLWVKATYAVFLIAILAVIDNSKFLGRRRPRSIVVTLEGTNLADGTVHTRVEELLGRKVDRVVVKSVTAVPPATKLQVTYSERAAG